MYVRGYNDGAIRFSYVPDFRDANELANWCAGIRAGKASQRLKNERSNRNNVT